MSDGSYQMLKVVGLSMTVAVTAFAVPLLLGRRTTRRDQVVLLAGFLAIYGAFKLDALLLESGFYLAAPHTSGVMVFARFLLPPAIFFYARAMTSPEPRWLDWRDLGAALWPCVFVAAMAPIYLQDAQVKTEMIAGNLTASPQGGYVVLLCKISFAAFLGVAITYLVLGLKLLRAHGVRMRDAFSNIDDLALNWLAGVLLVLAVGWAWLVVGDFLAMWRLRPPWYPTLTIYLELGWIGFIALYGVRQPSLYEEPAATTGAASGGYARSALSREQMARIGAKLERALVQNRLHVDPNLSLHTLSTHIGVSENYVSETLNKHLGVNFFEFVNRRRIDDACALLRAGDASVLTIAYEVGFNSRSTFHAAFKKFTGASPHAFRKQGLHMEREGARV